MSVRVRYAPSPTGSPHVGNVRTALFDHLFARHHGGVNILRIEDTDRARLVPGCEEEIIESLHWVGVEWQEGPDKGGPFAPYRQSERKEAGIYDQWSQRLLDTGFAYKAFDTPEELNEMREYQQINKQPIGYFGGVWRDASGSAVEAAERAGKSYVLRLKMPRGTTLVCEDAIRGRIEFASDDIDDPVLIKADGMPTYHFAAMVDDHLMQITHVIRGEEWIGSVAKHVWLFEAFGWQPPTFVHVPVIKGKDGSKLSKRHGDTACLDYKKAGYLPEALANFIALIGWAPGGDRELMSMAEMAEAFDLAGIQPSPGIFDLEKLHWMNGHYLRELSPEALLGRVEDYLSTPETLPYWLAKEPEEGKPDPADAAKPALAEFAPARVASSLKLLGETLQTQREYALEALKLQQERVTTMAGFGLACEFFLVGDVELDLKAVEKWFIQEHVPALFEALSGWLEGRSTGASPVQKHEALSAEECEAFVRSYAQQQGLEKLGPVVHPIRVALTGKTVGPGLFELMAVLGATRMAERLKRASNLLKSKNPA